ncbi:MAG: M20/M25/M40 family metallo-hydrolase [Phycisphaerae bacterium]|nr:M20/M25/M40 family metallo-hydrolase [Phycisphaerae bacterium]
MRKPDPAAVSFVNRLAGSDGYATYLRDTLVSLCAVNTAPDADLAATAAREQELFDLIQREVEGLCGGKGLVERPPINPALGADPAYTPPGYAADRAGRVPPAEQVYAGRTNLLVMVGGSAADTRRPVVQHAHVDVVPLWTPPRVEDNRIIGRGACDNKAQVAVLLAQIRLLDELQRHLGRQARCGRVYQFAIDEEIGGNGSLSLAMDPRFAGSPIIVHECTELVPYCAHRGCVYYRCRLSTGGGAAFGMFPHVVTALDEEGRRFQEETQHPLFGVEHVQANPGMLGGYGTTPGSVCDHVAVLLTLGSPSSPQEAATKVERCLAESIRGYCSLHGDKTGDRDAATGRPRLERHFSVECVSRSGPPELRVDVFGIGGHMGALSECDNAITKAAYMLRSVLDSSDKLFQDAIIRPGDSDRAAGDEIVLEGGQGFTPCHRMEDVKTRLLAAARRGVREYCEARGLRFDETMIEMSFDRLHNDAYAADPSIEPMQALLAARKAVGLPAVQVVGWQTSCDARLYHARGCPVAVFGAGRLDVAHSDHEYVDIAEMQQALAISTLAVWAMIA